MLEETSPKPKKKLSDDAVDGIAFLFIVTLIVTGVSIWLQTM
jgi:hypothetical protein